MQRCWAAGARSAARRPPTPTPPTPCLSLASLPPTLPPCTAEYNVLVHNNELYCIDVSQAVELDHPRAFDFLREGARRLAGQAAVGARWGRAGARRRTRGGVQAGGTCAALLACGLASWCPVPTCVPVPFARLPTSHSIGAPTRPPADCQHVNDFFRRAGVATLTVCVREMARARALRRSQGSWASARSLRGMRSDCVQAKDEAAPIARATFCAHTIPAAYLPHTCARCASCLTLLWTPRWALRARPWMRSSSG